MPDNHLPTVFKNELQTGYFQWQHIPYVERIHWNHLLHTVIEIDTGRRGSDEPNPESPDYIIDKRVTDDELSKNSSEAKCPNFYNQDACLALTLCHKGNDFDLSKQRQNLKVITQRRFKLLSDTCLDINNDTIGDLYPYLIKPYFNYHRADFNRIQFTDNGTKTEPMGGYQLQSLTVGSLVWLYFYERMGIFKILGVLLDDYNYRGKYSLSSQITGGVLKNKQYISLLEQLSFLTRQGLASTFRDRISTYQRVLGVTIQNDLNVQSAENSVFMKNFTKLINNMLEYYNAKRLSIAIQNNTTQVRSSVATQTAILNSIKVLSQNFEVMEYGRNMIHTFTGIATVYVTICLIKQIRDVIGIPHEYDAPEEYIPAAYDILVLKKQGTTSDSNRYTIFDNCASYGYRLLTDVQLANLSSFKLNDLNSTFDAWLSSVEEWVEGYNNAFKSIPDKTNSETAVATA